MAQYESRAKKADGGAGFIDVFWPGMLIAEQKSLGKLVAQAPLVALNEVEEGGFFRRLWDSFWMWWESE